MYNPTYVTHLIISVLIFPSSYYHLTDSNQAYSHSVKLPDDRSGQIRFLRYCAVSGSVPRPRNNHTALFRRCAPGHREGGKHNI